MSLFATVLAQTEELAPLIAPPLVIAGVAVAVFVVLAIVTWSYRDVANRHSQKVAKGDHDSHGAGH
jgi:heme/copper-type cytochrome/quinol oxidase subunit 2